ncbi:HAD-IB family hydrolase [bacterium]|nr:HAD-IB family hydrolase [bacterium]|tara:strand:- start:6699 stop:7382 length:684 start_codon:yes stop_codon:yes gene_type:complete
MKKVAIFDIDGTIFRSSIVIELVDELVKSGHFPKNAKAGYEKEFYNWLDRKGDYDDYISGVVRMFMKHIKGIPYKDFARVSERAMEENKDRVYRYTRDLVKNLKKEGYFLLAISQSPKTALDPFCKKLGFTKVYGRIYELGPQDRFTGKVVDEHLIENKSYILRRAVEKEGLTLKGSIGVGDTANDVSFLELVENPICFNPDQDLYRHAMRNGWKIIVERKNVIYEL